MSTTDGVGGWRRRVEAPVAIRVRTRAPRAGAGGRGAEGGRRPLPEKNTRDGCDALGWSRHCIWVGMDSYQHPSVAYGSGGKPAKSAREEPREHRPRGSVRGAARGEERDGRRARRGFVLNSDRYGLVRAAHSRVYFGQEAKSAQSEPCEKSRPDFSLPDRRLEFRPLHGPLRPCGTGFPSGQARRVHRRVQSRIKCSKLKSRIPALWGCRQAA